MTALTTAQIAKLNKMNRAAKDGTLGTRLNAVENSVSGSATVLGASGSYTTVAGDATGSRIVITTGMATVHGLVADYRRSGSAIPFMKITAGSVAGTIEVIKDPTYTGGSVIAASDVVTWFAF